MRRIGALVLALALLAGGCTPKMRAQRLLGKYEKVFASCRKLTEEAGVRPGEHSCAKVASLAVEASLRDTGLDAAEWQPMLAAWLTETSFAPYYIDSSKPLVGPEPTPPTPELVATGAPAGSASPTRVAARPVPNLMPTASGVMLAPPIDAGPPAPKKAAYAAGAKVAVLWQGKWWPASVLSVKADKYLIHYDGWSSTWDEWVTTARMKQR